MLEILNLIMGIVAGLWGALCLLLGAAQQDHQLIVTGLLLVILAAVMRDP